MEIPVSININKNLSQLSPFGIKVIDVLITETNGGNMDVVPPDYPIKNEGENPNGDKSEGKEKKPPY